MLKSFLGSQVYEEQQGHEQWLWEQHRVWAEKGAPVASHWDTARARVEWRMAATALKRSQWPHKECAVRKKLS